MHDLQMPTQPGHPMCLMNDLQCATCNYLSWLQPLPFTHLQLQIVDLPQLLPDPPQLLDSILLLHDAQEPETTGQQF